MIKTFIKNCLFSSGLFFTACSTTSIFDKDPDVQTVYVGYDSPAPIPPGVVRFCWEEPVVEFQDNGPGLDSDKRWYNPSYVAIRMVKQGRWRPCRSESSELKGETRNER